MWHFNFAYASQNHNVVIETFMPFWNVGAALQKEFYVYASFSYKPQYFELLAQHFIWLDFHLSKNKLFSCFHAIMCQEQLAHWGNLTFYLLDFSCYENNVAR